MSALEHARRCITSSSTSPYKDGRINALEASANELQGTIEDVVDDCRSYVEAIWHEMGELSTKLNLTILAVGNQPKPAPGGIEFTRAKVLEPRHYGGACDAKKVKNFLFAMEQYFRVVRAGSEDLKVSMATMYLSGDAKVWWRTKYDDLQHGRCIIATWDDLKREIKTSSSQRIWHTWPIAN